MSERVIIDCDKCGKEAPTPVRLRLHVGYDSDPVDGHTTKVVEPVDLCPECCGELVSSALNKLGSEWGAAVVKEWKAKWS